MMRELGVMLALLGCARAQTPTCELKEVPQDGNLTRVTTCREENMYTAFDLCEGGAPGLSMDDCLRQWVKVFDACIDEPDQQYT